MAHPAVRPRPASWSASPHTSWPVAAAGSPPWSGTSVARPGVLAPNEYWRRPGSAGRQPFGFDTALTAPAPLPQHLGAPQPWAPPTTPGKLGRQGRAWIVAGSVAATAVTVALIVGMAGNQAATAPVAPAQVQAPAPLPTAAAAPPTPSEAPSVESPVDDGDLVGLLPTPRDVARIMGLDRLASVDKLNGPGMFSDPADPAECIGVVIPDARGAYADSGVHVNYMQAWRDPESRTLSAIQTGVSTFDSAAGAQAFVDQQSSTWPRCSLKPIVVDPDDEHRETWEVSDVAKQGDTLVAHLSVRHIPGRCERALTARRNVVIDVVTCSQNPNGTATALTSTVTKKLGRAT